jgi:hypothetical protein
MLQKVADIVKSGVNRKSDVIRKCDNDQMLLSLIKQANSEVPEDRNLQCKIDFTKFGYSKLDRLLRKYGYGTWKHFVREINNFNHRIVSIKKVSNRDTGTITIDGYERWHDYHTFAIDSGIFVKNSTNEDFFFPQTAEGRGSKVEILQGGQNLGEITDLRFFTNKLFRGLRIPSSYLPTGVDDGTQNYNDGRVGTALIQEWRFNRYCVRLQNSISTSLDKEFKLFMRWRGINIDSQLFELKLNEPQNFAQYRQTEIDTARIQTYTQLEPLPYFSKRFLMKRYLGLDEQEMSENERMWLEEQGESPTKSEEDVGLRSVGITPGGIGADLAQVEALPAVGAEGGAAGEVGAAAGGPETPAVGAAGVTGPAPAGVPAGPAGI